MKKKLNSYNDGVAKIVKEVSRPTSFNAHTNAKTIEDFEAVGELWCKELSCRNEDLLFAEAMGKSLELKIKTPLVDWVEQSHKVIIGKEVYDIFKIDSNKATKELFLYLEGVLSLEE